MELEAYNLEDYRNKISALDKGNPVFLQDKDGTILLSDIMPFLDKSNRKVPQKIISRIVNDMLKQMKWKCRVIYYPDNHPDPTPEFTHNIILIDYKDQWHLAIQDQSRQIHSYGISDEAHKYISDICLNKLCIGNMITEEVLIGQTAIGPQDTNAMLKLLQSVLKSSEFKVKQSKEEIQQIQQEEYIIDMYLFAKQEQAKESYHRSRDDQYKRQNNNSKQSAKKFDPIESFQIPEQTKSKQLTLNFESSLQKSIQRYQPQYPPDVELVSLSKRDFVYMMDKFKKEVIQEVKMQDQQAEPNNFLAAKLAQFGQLKSEQKQSGIEYQVEIDNDQLQNMLKEYERFYHQQTYNAKYQENIKKSQEQYQYFTQFYQLLSYYYHADPLKYADMVKEYNSRINQQMVERLRGNQVPLIRGPSQQVNNSQNSVLKHSQFNQSINQSVVRNSNILNSINAQSQSEITKSQSQIQYLNLVALRYERSIGYREFQLLQEGKCSENILNFYIRYLEEKQSTQEISTLKYMKIYTLFLSTTFYNSLTPDGNNPEFINYDKAAHYTKQYIGKNNIFDRFDQILIPMIIDNYNTALLQVKMKDKALVYYGKWNEANLLCCMSFLSKEHNEKLMKPSVIYKWPQFQEPGNNDNLQTCYIIDCLSKGQYPSLQQAYIFKADLCRRIQSVGITKNKKHEIQFI